MNSDHPHLQLRFDRPHLTPEGPDPSEGFLIAVVPALERREEAAEAPAPPLELAVVVDVSGSMSGPRLDAAKEAAAGVVRTLRDGDHLTLVAFDHRVEVLLESLPLAGGGAERALAAITSLRARGTTNLSGGWRAAARIAAQELAVHPGRRAHVVLLSDGRANQGELEPSVLDAEARGMLGRGVPTSCVGIGEGYSTHQLAALSGGGGGRLHDAADPGEIVELLCNELGEIGAVRAEDARLELELPEGLAVEPLTDLWHLREGRRLRVDMGSLILGRAREVVLRVRCDGSPADAPLAVRGTLSWREPGETARECSSAEAAIRLREGRPAAIDDELQAVVVRHWEAMLRVRVADLSRDGDFTAIGRIEEADLPRLRRYAGDDAETAEVARRLGHFVRRSGRERIRERDRKTATSYGRATLRGGKRMGSGEALRQAEFLGSPPTERRRRDRSA